MPANFGWIVDAFPELLFGLLGGHSGCRSGSHGASTRSHGLPFSHILCKWRHMPSQGLAVGAPWVMGRPWVPCGAAMGYDGVLFRTRKRGFCDRCVCVCVCVCACEGTMHHGKSCPCRNSFRQVITESIIVPRLGHLLATTSAPAMGERCILLPSATLQLTDPSGQSVCP